jgi:hypothetical protein
MRQHAVSIVLVLLIAVLVHHQFSVQSQLYVSQLATAQAEQDLSEMKHLADAKLAKAEQDLTEMKHLADAKAAKLAKAEQDLTEMKHLADDPVHAKLVYQRGFQAAETWRAKTARHVYANITDADLDLAVRWKAHAYPFARNRTCAGLFTLQDMDEIARLQSNMVELLKVTPVTDSFRRTLLSLMSFHSTGIEGNTLSLPETALIIAGSMTVVMMVLHVHAILLVCCMSPHDVCIS